MPTWNENDYVKRAEEIASQHAVSKKSLNELCEKMARDENMNPNEIRTLVRLANVATFQELFKRKDDGDKMVEFDTGDPEKVISNIVSAAGQEPESANIHNDKLSSEIPDQMREVRQGFKFEAVPEVKVASDDAPVKPGRTDLVVLNLQKLAENFEVERLIAGRQWEEALDKLAHECRKIPVHSRDTVLSLFEKDALATYGNDIMPELVYTFGLVRRDLAVPSAEKIAQLKERHVVEDTKYTRLLKTAQEARQHFLKFESGLAWIKKNTPILGG